MRQYQHTKKEKRIKRISPSTIAIVAIVSVVALIGGVFANYAYNKLYLENRLGAKDFYFTVDLLGDTTTVPSLNDKFHIYGGGEKEIPFAVQNFFDNKRVTAYDVVYNVSVSSDIDFTLEKDGGIISQPHDYTILGAEKASHKYKIIPDTYNEGNKITVNVESTNPYNKKMVITFVLHKSDNVPVLYRVEDSVGSPYAELIVMSNEDLDAGKLAIDWSAINSAAEGDNNYLQIDTTNEYIHDSNLLFTTNTLSKNTLTSVTNTKAINPRESISIYFFKKNPQIDYSTAKSGDTYIDLSNVTESGGVYTITLTNWEG